MGLHTLVSKDGFRLRGTEMSRIDGFSDVVFGFALTLIVVSLEVPKRYSELHELILSIVPFFVTFTLFFAIWWAHFRFFRRYGVHDNATIVLNAGLLFTVLVYVYPLKFLFSMFVGGVLGHGGGDAVFDNMYQVRELMVFYGAGFATIYFLFASLYWNALKQKDCLELNALEVLLTKSYIEDNIGVGMVGVLCIVAACALPVKLAGMAGYTFLLIGVWKTIHGTIAGKRARKMRMPANSAPTEA